MLGNLFLCMLGVVLVLFFFGKLVEWVLYVGVVL